MWNWLYYESYNKALGFFFFFLVNEFCFFLLNMVLLWPLVLALSHPSWTTLTKATFLSTSKNNFSNSISTSYILLEAPKGDLEHTHTNTHKCKSLWFIQHIKIKSFTLFSALSFTVLRFFISVISENIRYSAHQRWICTKGQNMELV